MTKNKIDVYFQDSRLETNAVNFSNTEQWSKLINDILKNFEDGTWRIQKTIIELNYENIKFKDYEIIYQNILNVLYFLFDHKSFKNNLIYESCHILKLVKDNKKIKVYSKIYTIDGW